MFEIVNSNQFKKDLKRCKKRGYNIDLFIKTITQLASKGKLESRYKPHKLSGNYNVISNPIG